MDSRTRSAFGRLEIVETGRRGRWSEDEKARIVLESLAGPRLVSLTARRHGISRSQLLAWRRTLRPERSEAGPVPGFVPAVIVPEPPTGVTSKTGLGCAKSGDDRNGNRAGPRAARNRQGWRRRRCLGPGPRPSLE